MRTIVSQGVPKELDCLKFVSAFSNVFTEEDTVNLLKAMVESGSKQRSKTIQKLFSCQSFKRCDKGEKDTAILTAAVIQKILSSVLKHKNQSLTEDSRDSLLGSFVQFLKVRPIYLFAFREGKQVIY